MAPRSRALALLAALVLGACAPSSAEPAPRVTAPSPAAGIASAPAGPLLPGRGTYAVVPPGRYVQVWRSPGPQAARRFIFDTVNPFGAKVPLLVTEARRDSEGTGWLKVLLPIRPNESSGWVRASDVRLVSETERIVVDLSQRVLRHFRNGKLVRRLSVGIGRPESPTATGTFYVWARVPQSDPTGPYGSYALGISGFSEVLKDWPGGARMAVHGTADPSDRGRAVSHGCVRVYNPEMLGLRHVPLGTPVIIKR